MSADINEALTTAVRRILTPLVRLLIRQGISFAAVSELLSETYIRVAQESFAIEGRKQSVSRIATLTGLSRKKVAEVLNAPTLNLREVDKQYNRAARVISGWLTDPDYQNTKGKPLALTFDDDSKNFTGLVKRFSGDIPPRAILDELIRVGAIEQQANGKYRLVDRAYIPNRAIDSKLAILGADVSDLVETIEHNIHGQGEARFQRKVAYNAIPVKEIQKLKPKLEQQAQLTLEKLNTLLAKHDTDTNNGGGEKGSARVGVGIYYFEET